MKDLSSAVPADAEHIQEGHDAARAVLDRLAQTVEREQHAVRLRRPYRVGAVRLLHFIQQAPIIDRATR